MAGRAASVKLDPTKDSGRIRLSLERVSKSEMFVNAGRLRSFLSYVVEETLADRGNGILAKTIAQDVYGRSPDKLDSRVNLVRVDAGRLRRKLTEYYETVGATDDTRIHMDSGGYVPWFEDCTGKSPTENPRPARHKKFFSKRWVIGASALAVVAVSTGLTVMLLQSPEQPQPPESTSARDLKRLALAAKSPATVQASNYCDHARGLLFPIASVGNQKLATGIFRQAQESDPDYVCSYAGLGHSLATSARLTPLGTERDDLIQEAVAMAQTAVELAPNDGWSQSAIAWASFAAGDLEKAKKHSELAEALSPEDGNVLDFRGLMLLMFGQFSEAYDVTNPKKSRKIGSYRFAHRNLHAVASFHLGKYNEAVSSLNFAAQHGDPVSPLSLVFLAASYQGLQNTDEARKLLDQLRESWPNFRPETSLAAFYSRPELAEGVISNLKAAGWTPAEQEQ